MSYLLRISGEPHAEPVELTQDHLDSIFAMGEAHPLSEQPDADPTASFGTLETLGDAPFMWGSEVLTEGRARVLFEAGLTYLLQQSLTTRGVEAP